MKLQLSKLGVIGISIALACTLLSCSGGRDGSESSTTGWKYNSKENGGFEYKKDYKQPVGPGLIYIPEMRKVVAEVMGLDMDDVSIKATTTEKLGFEGREEGISAYATVLIIRDW